MLNFLLRSVKHNPYTFAGVLIALTISKIALIIPPIVIGKIVDAITRADGFSLSDQWMWIWGFLGAGIVQSLTYPVQALLLNTFINNTIQKASLEWSQKILSKDFFLFDGLRLGQLIKAVERGIEAHETLLHQATLTVLPLAIQLIVYLLLVWSKGGVWITSLLLCAGTVYLTVTHFIIRWRRPHIDHVNECEDAITGEFATLFTAAKSVKLERAGDTAIIALWKAYKTYARAAIRVGVSGAFLESSQNFIILLATTSILLWGLFDQTASRPFLSAGDLVVLFTVSGSLFATLSGLGQAYRMSDQFKADIGRFCEYLAMPDFSRNSRASGAIGSDSALKLEASPVSTDHPDDGGEVIILSQPLHIAPTQSVALIGASGSGKTTLLERLSGLKRQYRDRLKIGNARIDDLSDEEHLSRIRYCPQTAQFLEGDITQAVFFGQARDYENAARDLHLNSLVDGGNRIINEGATDISGGEARRLSLLRILSNAGRFNLFDEPTAGLNAALVTPVWDAIFAHLEGASIIAATHDITNLHRFDRVIALDRGRIIADGPYSAISSLPEIHAIVMVIEKEAASVKAV
ncbi:MAG: ABC transporter ATP-binding protein [Hyphomicrobiales bacterium]